MIRDFAYDLHRCVLQVLTKTAVQNDAFLTIYGAICKCDDFFLHNRKISENSFLGRISLKRQFRFWTKNWRICRLLRKMIKNASFRTAIFSGACRTHRCRSYVKSRIETSPYWSFYERFCIPKFRQKSQKCRKIQKLSHFLQILDQHNLRSIRLLSAY